jgi:hypothetical protein
MPPVLASLVKDIVVAIAAGSFKTVSIYTEDRRNSIAYLIRIAVKATGFFYVYYISIFAQE